MSIELLNLDDLVTTTRFVTIRGNEYAIADQTLEQMLTALKKSKELNKKGKEVGPEQIIQEMRDTCAMIIPDAPAEVLNTLSIKQAAALIEFASKSPEQIMTESEPVNEQAGEVGKSE